jgi:hypothetical protein
VGILRGGRRSGCGRGRGRGGRVCWPWPRDRIWSKKPPGSEPDVGSGLGPSRENSAGREPEVEAGQRVRLVGY